MGQALGLEDLEDLLEDMQEKDLFHYVQRCVCMSIAEANDPQATAHSMLDLAYAECARRGKERLYDKAYETVCREPTICNVVMR